LEVRAGHLKCIRRRLRNQEQICADWQVYAFPDSSSQRIEI